MCALVDHSGGCHCGAVRWVAKAPEVIDVIHCNCSVCRKKCNAHFIVDSTCFHLIKGEDSLTTYRFNTGVAQHRFCKVCGVQSFYIPRSNPNDVAIMPHCIDSQTVKEAKITTFDGENWEHEMKVNPPIAFTPK